MHRDSTQLTHYHSHLGWKSTDRSGREPDNRPDFLLDYRVMFRLSQHYLRVLLASLGILGANGVISRIQSR